MLKVAVTGGIGTGKTTFCSFLKEFGIKIIDLDSLCREFLKKGHVCYKNLVNVFGRGILREDGTIDRKKLAKIVFNNKKNFQS